MICAAFLFALTLTDGPSSQLTQELPRRISRSDLRMHIVKSAEQHILPLLDTMGFLRFNKYAEAELIWPHQENVGNHE